MPSRFCQNLISPQMGRWPAEHWQTIVDEYQTIVIAGSVHCHFSVE